MSIWSEYLSPQTEAEKAEQRKALTIKPKGKKSFKTSTAPSSRISTNQFNSVVGGSSKKLAKECEKFIDSVLGGSNG
ncbi:hypothetical protein [Salinivibrio phage CW02]|uniref:Uncharacterized protein n=1 Tax=Salinivibrio phage CW02 TaxID=1161935 RepID=H9D1I3_9CAUD|nr:hypothetical protein F490_gp12 [Salinivibrio phage CW02]AFE86225.1 hypothetical protein [Salinivibrio phage CW02]